MALISFHLHKTCVCWENDLCGEYHLWSFYPEKYKQLTASLITLSNSLIFFGANQYWTSSFPPLLLAAFVSILLYPQEGQA